MPEPDMVTWTGFVRFRDTIWDFKLEYVGGDQYKAIEGLNDVSKQYMIDHADNPSALVGTWPGGKTHFEE